MKNGLTICFLTDKQHKETRKELYQSNEKKKITDMGK